MNITISMAAAGVYSFRSTFNIAKTIAPKNRTIFRTKRTLLALGDSFLPFVGFIAQEMGREINTLGSKSNHAEMQKIVVQMKDELEQIKEQVLNVM